jgi:hypothetical protein
MTFWRMLSLWRLPLLDCQRASSLSLPPHVRLSLLTARFHLFHGGAETVGPCHPTDDVAALDAPRRMAPGLVRLTHWRAGPSATQPTICAPRCTSSRTGAAGGRGWSSGEQPLLGEEGRERLGGNAVALRRPMNVPLEVERPRSRGGGAEGGQQVKAGNGLARQPF